MRMRSNIWIHSFTLILALTTIGMGPGQLNHSSQNDESAKQAFFKYTPEDKKTQCIEVSEAEFLIAKYKVRLETFPRVRNSLSAELCAPQSKLRRILEAIRIIEFASFNDYPSGFVNRSYSDFFLERSTEILGKGCESQWGSFAIACHQTNKGPTMVGQNIFHYPPLFIAGALLHEARHADGFDHVNCTNPKMGSASQGCDSQFSDGGSYAVQAEFFARIAVYGRNFDSTLRETARGFALDHVEMHFNEPTRWERRYGFEKINDPQE